MKQATYAKIGTFALAALLLAAAAATLMGKGLSRSREALFETYIEETTQGISEGAAVKYRGIPIGSVKSVTFAMARYTAPDDSPESRRAFRYSRVVFAIDLKEYPDPDSFLPMVEKQVADGLRAHTKSQGITGLSYIDLDYVSSPEDLPVPWTPEYPYIPIAPSLAKTLTDVLFSLSQEIRSLSQVKIAVTNLAARTTVLADTATGAMETLQLGLAGVPAALGSATNAIADADALLRSLKPTADGLPSVIAEATQLVAEARTAIAELRPEANGALSAVSNAVASAGEAVGALSPSARSAVESLSRAADEIAALAAELKSDPSILIRGTTQESLP